MYFEPPVLLVAEVFGQRLGVQDELAAFAAFFSCSDRDLDAELVRRSVFTPAPNHRRNSAFHKSVLNAQTGFLTTDFLTIF